MHIHLHYICYSSLKVQLFVPALKRRQSASILHVAGPAQNVRSCSSSRPKSVSCCILLNYCHPSLAFRLLGLSKRFQPQAWRNSPQQSAAVPGRLRRHDFRHRKTSATARSARRCHLDAGLPRYQRSSLVCRRTQRLDPASK